MKIFVKNNYLFAKNQSFRCSVGHGGLSNNKIEGDRCTPVGKFKFDKIYYRADKLGRIDFSISSAEISKNDGWCDDPSSKFYNQLVQFPFESSAEKLYREDDLYDIICVINYNTDPVIPGKGSAIFLHICKEDFAHTEGCIAVEKKVLLQISKQIKKNSNITIEN
jgi:L,D-peptidoglycan transpeptidase YkuD (ErfK/YbiS/YcfS/YnhG family)|tara:strand:+ start:170 stop:664 length:495 start_codon:yes stop_codon:yes gene_type:complete